MITIQFLMNILKGMKEEKEDGEALYAKVAKRYFDMIDGKDYPEEKINEVWKPLVLGFLDTFSFKKIRKYM